MIQVLLIMPVSRLPAHPILVNTISQEGISTDLVQISTCSQRQGTPPKNELKDAKTLCRAEWIYRVGC